MNPSVVDNDAGEITVALAGRELRGWNYANDSERRAKMLAAREYVEGWSDARSSAGSGEEWNPTDEQVRSAAMWYRHDLGLLTVAEATKVKTEARLWLRSWQKEVAALRAEPQASADSEPVAYRWLRSKGDVRWEFGARAPSAAWKVSPLYAAPQPRNEPQASAVSAEEKMPVARPVAFRVPRVVNDRLSKTEFRLFDDEDEARRAACDIGADYDGLFLVADRRAAFFAQPRPSTVPQTAWICAARKQALPEPAECNWPDCGCDPHAMKVIESLIEQGWSAPRCQEASGGEYVKLANEHLARCMDENQALLARIEELTCPRSQAGIEQRHLAQLLTILSVMKSAHSREPDRLMSIWSRDIEAVEAAVAALTRPVCEGK